ncbi:MAG: RluA family pseudouridine synthase [Archangium sp.]|nr:RluA family pseudouridine synthase [Archangium sp.]
MPADAPERLDAFLVKALPGYSKQQIQKLLSDGKVRVNGKKAKPLRRIMGGEIVDLDVAAPNKPPRAEAHKDLPRLTVLHQTRVLAVIDKPTGLVVEDAPDSVVTRAAVQLDGLDVGGKHEPGIVHRIDKDTTGCLLLAKTDGAVVALQRAFDEKRIKKTYLALVLGNPPDTQALDQPYGRHPEDPRRYTTRYSSPRRARLSWKKLKQLADTAVLEIDLDTGRTHQIRAQLADAGFPLLGDWLYGTTEARARGIGETARIALHAWKLELRDPTMGFRLEAPLPADLARAIEPPT